jgi:hypothetical protein
MSMIDRLAGFVDAGNDETFRRIPVDYFWAHLYELSQGRVTRAQIIARFNLDAAEVVELDWLIGKYNAQPNATAKTKFVELMRVFFIMAEGDAPGYTTNAQLQAKINAL